MNEPSGDTPGARLERRHETGGRTELGNVWRRFAPWAHSLDVTGERRGAEGRWWMAAPLVD